MGMTFLHPEFIYFMMPVIIILFYFLQRDFVTWKEVNPSLKKGEIAVIIAVLRIQKMKF